MRALAALVLILALTGCGEDHPPAEPEPVARAPEPVPEPRPEPTCDASDRSPTNYACACPTIDRADDRVSMLELLCVADEKRASHEAPVRVGELLEELPVRFRRNFTLKHGTREAGLRGHVQEVMADLVHRELAQNSQSADLDFPRVILWDEQTGFTISYNGGVREQTGGDRLDMFRVDPETHAFELWALPLPIDELTPTQPATHDDNCTRCHGPRSRPIWPMYPDWPGFYGSDNDEVTKDTEHQRIERSFLSYFRHCVAPGVANEDEACASVRARLDHDEQDVLFDRRHRYDTLFADELGTSMGAIFEASDQAAIRAYITGLATRMRPAVLARVRTPGALAASEGSPEELRAWMGLELHDAFPYRPNHFDHSSEASRAFFHRPNLRLGVLYNRLNALAVFERIRAHEAYRAFERLIAFTLMDCGWADDDAARAAILARFEAAVGERLSSVGMSLGDTASARHRILYPALLAALDLQVRDVDIRFTYVNRQLDPFDRDYTRRNVIRNVMAIGYYPYASANDNNAANGSSHHFASYFDDSATMDELLVALILGDLASEEGSPYGALYELQSLRQKYERFAARYVLDRPFFEAMDALGAWFPLPYPRALEEPHHRETFTPEFRAQYEAVCAQLRTDMGSSAPAE